MDQLVIFDTTLRDGEQSPGATMTGDEKVRIAQQLERLGVDVIEAGFAAASVGDFLAIQRISSLVKESTVCSLSRAVERDIERAGEAIKGAARKRIHTFIATSPIHMEMKLHMTPDQVVERAVKAVKLAREYTDDVEFSAEDASRSDPAFLARICEEAIKAGATTINLPDTRSLSSSVSSSSISAPASRIRIRRSGPCTVTMTSAWRPRIRFQAFSSAARGSLSARLTALANVPATARLKRS